MSVLHHTDRHQRRNLNLPLALLLAALTMLVVAPSVYASHKPAHVPAPSHDATPPETTISSGPDSRTTSTSATFRFSSSERHSTFTCSLDGSAFEECVSPRSYQNLPLGDHVFRVRATDRAGNTDPTPAEHSWTIVGPEPPPGEEVRCGQTLTRSTTVGNDLSECDDGLIIGASNITVDLNGHVIDGKGLGVGVRNDGHDGVTIRNGSVKQFDYGVLLGAGTATNVVERLGVDVNELAGVQLDGAGSANQVRNNSVTLNGSGIALVNGATSNVVIGNTVSDNEVGLRVQSSSGNRLESNGVTGSGDADVLLEAASTNVLLRNTVLGGGDGGINLTATSNGNRLEGNTSSQNGDAGINVIDSSGNELVSNTAHSNSDDGIVLERGDGNVVLANDVRFNPGGLELLASSRNRLEGNEASDGLGRGITLGGLSLDNDLVLNRANRNGSQGIYLGDEAAVEHGNLLDGNTASANSGDGIHVAKGGHTIKANVVNDNSGWGIYAALGNVDGGGNQASGNSEPTQCFNVVCR